MAEPHPAGEEDDAAGRMIRADEIPDNEERRPIIAGNLLDIEAYAARYLGRTKITRLLFIAKNCAFRHMELKALRMAYKESKEGEDAELFKEIVKMIGGRLGEEYGPDDVWADAVDERALEWEANALIKLDIYRAARSYLTQDLFLWCYTDLGDFHYKRGDFHQACRYFELAAAYCRSPDLRVDRCLDLITVDIENGNFSRVPTFVRCAEQSPNGLSTISNAKLCCAFGMVHLEKREYKLAAQEFVQASRRIGLFFSKVIVPQDIAIYGGLCAVASFDHEEFENLVIDNANFQAILELVPEIRELAYNFYFCEYATFFMWLGILKENLLLDIHLHDHVDDLYEHIRTKALIEYTSSVPDTIVDLRTMANAFVTSVTGLELELAVLMANHQIQGLINLQDDLLIVDPLRR